MPAKNLLRIADKGTFCHVYNRGVEKRVIFADENDYKAFVGFLEDYLNPPVSSENIRESFVIKGRTFEGTPHRPKNYFNKVELIAYRLRPNHFHLLLHQVEEGAIGKFLRSLCTRYSIYFNKRHQRAGTLFEGPYKSAQIKDLPQLLQTSLYLHRLSENGEDDGSKHSSYFEYLGERKTPWVKSDIVLSFFKQEKEYLLKGMKSYEELIKRYEPTQEQRELLEKHPSDHKYLNHERRILTSQGGVDHTKTISKPLQNDYPTKSSINSPRPKIIEIATISLVFMLLTGLGIRNIKISTVKTLGAAINATSPTPIQDIRPPTTTAMPTQFENAPSTTPIPLMADKEVVKNFVVKIADGSPLVNIRQNPSLSSQKVGEAKDGDKFEYISRVDGWYEIKVLDGLSGFISPKYGFLEEAP